jgi:hypothetical protein
MKTLILSSLLGLALVSFTGCTNTNEATPKAKCQSGKCDSAKKDTKKCDAKKCDAKKCDSSKKCGTK